MINILKIELTKLKNSSLLTIIIILTLTPLFNGVSISKKLSAINSNSNTLETIYDFSINLYTLLILPTIIVIIFALIMRFERVNGGVKEMLILPITKKQLFLSKLVIGVLLVSTSIFMFTIGIIFSGFLQKCITIKSLLLILLRMLVIFLVSLGIIGVQYYLSLTYENISVPLGLGLCFQIPTILISASKYNIIYPWSYITTVNNIATLDIKTVIMITVSIVIFILINLYGYMRFNGKDIY
ncbi:ABC transporter permease [Clostridium oceanicum]|uniref:ABC-2 family transporter protein n=1 Tax=Clostridium oceanicum TaxID=1543 RepID=A0ABN1JXE2_9CLOT